MFFTKPHKRMRIKCARSAGSMRLDNFFDKARLDEIKDRLNESGSSKFNLFPNINQNKKINKSAAVLVPFCNVNGSPSVLFTLRSLKLSSHSGQVSFPGGMFDEIDSTLFETALRESEEEIGLNRAAVEILGQLPPLPNRNFDTIVTPVIAFCSDIDLNKMNINHKEVFEVFHCTLDSLMLKSNLAYTTFNSHAVKYKLPVFLNQKHKIWGLTALILHQTLHISFPKLFPFNFKLLR